MPPRSSTTSDKSGKKAIKSSTGKTAAAKPPPKRPAATRSPSRAGKPGPIPQEERMRLIAETAYFKAEKREFAGGSELGDWIEAEAEIDALLGTCGASQLQQ